MSQIEKLIERLCPDGVPSVTVGSVLIKNNSSNPIPKNLYKDFGEFPIINQAQKLIAGYSDESHYVIKADKYIVFGDHTRAIKWVEFAFIPGESGTLIFRINKD